MRPVHHKHALRPIRRASHSDVRPLESAATSARSYPDARTLSLALRDAAARAARVLAIPIVGVGVAAAGGCNGAGRIAEGLSPPSVPILDVRIGEVVEGLRPPLPATEIVPLVGAEVPVPIDLVPPTTLRPAVPQPILQPIPLGGDVAPVQPDPLAPPVDGEAPAVEVVPLPAEDASEQVIPPAFDDDRPMVRGGIRRVRPDPMPIPGGPRAIGPVSRSTTDLAPVPRTLSDQALAQALASIR